MEDVRTGLAKVLADTPVKTGYLEMLAGWAPSTGVVGRAEAGYRPAQNLALFGFGQWSSKLGPSAGVGARLEF